MLFVLVLQFLPQNKQIVIQKSDKGNYIIIVARDKYIEKMENFLSDESKFKITAVKDDILLNFITSQEKRIDKIFKRLLHSNSMPKETRRHLQLVGTKPIIMHGSFKVHKKVLMAVYLTDQFSWKMAGNSALCC